MRNPNGYGSVVKLSGNRRRPWAVRKTKDFNEKGHPVYQFISYHATRKEALIALANYNRNPYDVNASKITLSELYHKWYERSKDKLALNTLTALKRLK